MEGDNTNLLPDALSIALRVTGLLEQFGIQYLIGGSVASIVHGEARLTNDLDLVADIAAHQVPALAAALAHEFYVDDVGIQRAIRERSSFNLIHLATMFKVDVFIDRGDAWALEQMRCAESVALLYGDDTTVRRVAGAETMILQKLLWFRKGGEVSDRQWRDVLGMLKVQADRLDYAYLQDWATRLGVADLLDKAVRAANGAVAGTQAADNV